MRRRPKARRVLVATLTLATAVAATLVGVSSDAEVRVDGKGSDSGAASLPACIAVRAEARYVPYGYNHVVILTSGCTKAATCLVSTDVNPQVVTTEVAAGQTVEVLTFSASPAQRFTPHVTCSLH